MNKVKIQYISDIHLEFGRFDYRPSDSDIVVIAGDLGPGLSGVKWIQRFIPDKPVVYVCGNHEFYTKRDMVRVQEKIREATKETNIHFLQNSSKEIFGIKFLGATLWTDYALYGNPDLAMMWAKANMNDFTQITYSGSKALTPLLALMEHKETVEWLKSELALTPGQPSVVVTHHGPSEANLHPIYRGSPDNPSYASNLNNLILDHSQIKAWIHGHSHKSMQTQIGECLVVCNPRGYVGHELNKDFDPLMAINVNAATEKL